MDSAHTSASTRELATVTTAGPGPLPLPPPERIGRFEVERELGRGGAGVVYEAHDPRLDRPVAIKVVHLHRVGPRGRARVHREARALAKLSHPNVVQVFEVGDAEILGGGPGTSLYLAMEHVEGQTLRQWSRAAPRSVDEVLAVYRQAAEGLAAAHDKGLVHRDFKPDNAIIGTDGRVRVLDFGLARQQDDDAGADGDDGEPRATGDGITEDGTVMGTPAYMAPEQFLGARLDARIDQFALCVSIFEALYGVRPFEGTTRLALLDAVVQGRMRAPPEARGVPPRVLLALRRGLSSEPTDRFADLRALMDALQPPRRRATWLLLGLATAGLLGWGAWSTQRDDASCQDAARQWHAVWTDARREAVGRALGEAPVPYAAHARDHVLSQLDAYGRAWIDERIAVCTASRSGAAREAPAMERRLACLGSGRRRFAALVDVLAQADAGVAEHAVAAVGELPSVARCVELGRSAPASAVPIDPQREAQLEALREQLDSAAARHDAGRNTDARERVQQVVARARALQDRPLLAQGQLLLGRVQDELGEPAAASESLRAAFFEAQAGDLFETSAHAAIQLVFVEGYRLDRYADADTWAEHARAALERLGDDTLEPSLAMAVATVDLARGRYEDARRGYEHALAGMTTQLGPTHPRVALVLGNLANAELYLGHLQTAVELDLRALAIEREALGRLHPQVSKTTLNLGSIHFRMKRYDEARQWFERSLEIDLATVGPQHPSVVNTRSNLALVDYANGDYARAVSELQQVLTATEAVHGEDSLEAASVRGNLAGALLELGRRDEALGHLRRAAAIREREQGPDHPELARNLYNLALVEQEAGQLDPALEHARRALAVQEQTLPPLHYDRSSTHVLLSDLLQARGELLAARDEATRAVAIREQSSPSPGDLARARMRLGDARWALGDDRAAARALVQQAHEGFVAAGDDWAVDAAEAIAWLDQHPLDAAPADLTAP